MYYTITVWGNILDNNLLFLHFIRLIGVIILMIQLYQNSYKARRWIKFAVIPSFIPIIFVIMYDAILGYNFKNIINRHLIDFILVVFAIAVSVFGTAIDLHKKIKSEKDEEKSENYVLFSLAIGLWCTAFFTFLYDKLKPEDNLSFKKIIFCLVQIGITFIIVYKGMQAENELESLSQIISSVNNNSNNNFQTQKENKSNVQ